MRGVVDPYTLQKIFISVTSLSLFGTLLKDSIKDIREITVNHKLFHIFFANDHQKNHFFILSSLENRPFTVKSEALKARPKVKS